MSRNYQHNSPQRKRHSGSQGKSVLPSPPSSPIPGHLQEAVHLLRRAQATGDRGEVQGLVQGWQQTLGNQAVGQIFRLVETEADRSTIHRNPGDDDATAEVDAPERTFNVTLTLGDREWPVEISNYGDLADGYAELSSLMFFEEDEYLPDRRDNGNYDEWERYDDYIDEMIYFYSDNPIWDNDTQVIYDEVRALRQANGELQAVARRCRRAYEERQEEYVEELGRARGEAERAEVSVREAIRSSFLSTEDAEDLNLPVLWSMADHLATFAGEMTGLMGVGYHVAMAGRLAPPVITLANVAVNWASESALTTGSGFEGMAALNNAVSIGGALNSFFINPGYIVTAYIGPMLGAITEMMGRLQVQLIRINDGSAGTLGYPMYINSEPGGQAMWDYMVRVMHAGSVAEIPNLPESCHEYFDDYRDRFDEFNQGRYEGERDAWMADESRSASDFPTSPDEIPTESSWVFWSTVDTDRFDSWIFQNRETVWISLYGSRDPETAVVYPY